jgi:DnaJ family protein C protein 25
MLRPRLCYSLRLVLLLFWLTVVVVAAAAAAAEGDESAGVGSGEADGPTKTDETEAPKIKDGFDVENEDWGSYYDPQNIFCGKYDCYKILGFDYESFGKIKPSTKEITQRYRKLSREWHPDKSKHKNAKARFVKIARAYEVLTGKDVRVEYDLMRYNQEAYYSKYGTSVLWSYAPKTDATMVLLLLLIMANVISWYSQKHRWRLVADRLTRAAVEDWTARDGGTVESKKLREDALAILAEQEAEAAAKEGEEESTNGNAAAAKSAKKKAAKKVPGRERKKQEQDALAPIVAQLVNAIDDFGGGFHKPTVQDLFFVLMLKLPFKMASGVAWQTGYWFRRLQRKELTDEERQVLTERAVGPVTWSVSSEEERQEMAKRELWVMEKLVEWKEEQEIKNLSAAEQKAYNKLKKKGKLDKVE